MGFKKFLASKTGALTGAILGIGAGAGANVAIASTLKEDLINKAQTEKITEFMIENDMTDVSMNDFMFIIRDLAKNGNEIAQGYLKDIDLAGSAAAITAHYQPSTLIGTAAVAGAILVGWFALRHQAKKSLKQEEMEFKAK